MSVGVWTRGAGGRWALAATAAGALVAVIAVVGLQAAARSRVAGQRAVTTAYVEALEPVVMDAGRIVELGVKDGLAQLSAAAHPDRSLAHSSQSWQRQLTLVRTRLELLEVPRGLDASGFSAAVDSYIAAAAALEEAAERPAAQRAQLLAEVTAAGRAADADWDAAVVALKAHMRQLGLPPAGWLSG